MINGIPNIADKWKPCNGMFIKAFISVSGKFNKVTISGKSVNNNVITDDAVNKQKQINDAHHAQRMLQ